MPDATYTNVNQLWQNLVYRNSIAKILVN